MLGSVERQTLGAVMVDHLRDAGKHTAALVQGVAVPLSLSHDDVNAALARPNSQGRRRRRRRRRRSGTRQRQTHYSLKQPRESAP